MLAIVAMPPENSAKVAISGFFRDSGEGLEIGRIFKRKNMIWCISLSQLSQLQAMTNDQNLEKIFVDYATGSHDDLKNYLNEMPQSSTVDILMDLLTMYINDSNSSAVREQITTKIAGYTHRPEKLGYNGFKFDAKGQAIDCEAKPKNIKTHQSKPPKLNGSGGFNDYRWNRLDKDQKANLNIIPSGFVDGRLLYIIEFPFNLVLHKFKYQLKGKLPEGDATSVYLRSATFSYLDYKDDKNTKLVYLTQDAALLRKHTVEKFHEWLTQQEVKN